MSAQPNLVISSRDYEKINDFLDNLPGSENVDLLIAELERASIVDDTEMPANVVAMHSTVDFTVLSTGKAFTYTLAYPWEVEEQKSRLSILTPVGSALLGLSEGQEIEWPLAHGKTTRVRIDRVYPPSLPQ